MSRGKYARKHQRELEKSVNESQQSPLLDDIFDGSYNFISKFKTLDTDTQLEIVRLLHNIVKKEENSPSSGEEKHYAEDARYFLNNIYKPKAIIIISNNIK